MDNHTDGSKLLIDSIKTGALKEAEAVRERVKKEIETRENEARREVESILREGEKRGEELAAEIKKKNTAAIAAEMKKLKLQAMGSLFEFVEEQAKQLLFDWKKKDDYPDLLEKWIVEGILGLGVSAVVVNASKDELPMIDSSLHERVKKHIKKITGMEVEITNDTGEPLTSQGVVVKAADGKTEYNNQVLTRFLRYRKEIRSLVYSSLRETGKQSHE